MDLTSKMVEDTIDELVENGWCQGMYNDSEGRYCTIGAFRNVAFQSEMAFLQRQGLLAQFAKKLDAPYVERIGQNDDGSFVVKKFRSIADWNDNSDQTKEKVVDALTKVAKDLRNEGK